MTLKRKNAQMKINLKIFMGDQNYLSDENGIVDVSNDDEQPQTPKKPNGEIVSPQTPSILDK